MKNKRKLYAAAELLIVLLLCGCAKSGDGIVWENEQLQSQSNQETVQQEEIGQSDMLSVQTEPAHIFVDICGAVRSPGVYRLQEGARVYEAIRLAGGLREDADPNTVNQAQKLTDGAKIRIYTVEEAAKANTLGDEASYPAGEMAAEQKINLNTAGAAQLCELPGIGESRAADIIAYRTEHGVFKDIEEIMNVSGIKEATFNKIKDKIAVE